MDNRALFGYIDNEINKRYAMKFQQAVNKAVDGLKFISRPTYRKGSYVYYNTVLGALIRVKPDGSKMARFRSGDVLANDWRVSDG